MFTFNKKEDEVKYGKLSADQTILGINYKTIELYSAKINFKHLKT
jgi:hypothetical protein